MDFEVSIKDSRVTYVVETNSLVLVAAGVGMVAVESKGMNLRIRC